MHHSIPPDQASMPYVVNFLHIFKCPAPTSAYSMCYNVQLHVARITPLFRPTPPHPIPLKLTPLQDMIKTVIAWW